MRHSRLVVPFLAAACAVSAYGVARQQAPAPQAQPRNVAILVYPGVELLDFAGPGEVFAATHTKEGHAFEVYTVAETREPVKSMGFVTVTPQYTVDDCPKPDIVVVPGGDVPSTNKKLVNWVAARARDTELMMSVCNGALLYAQAGLLENLEVTTHHSTLQSLALIEPSAKVYSNRRFVDNGRVLTSAGISAGIDGALYVVSRLLGEERAWETARYMEYDWRPDEIAKLHSQPGRGVDDADAWHWIAAPRKLGIDGALAEFRALAKPPTEAQMNRWGYTLLNAEKSADALELLRFVAAAFPTSSNASDSLSEVYEFSGDKNNAIATAKDALTRLAKEPGVDEQRAQLIRNAAKSRIARLNGAKPSELPYHCAPCGGTCDRVGYLEGGRCPGCPMELSREVEHGDAKD